MPANGNPSAARQLHKGNFGPFRLAYRLDDKTAGAGYGRRLIEMAAYDTIHFTFLFVDVTTDVE